MSVGKIISAVLAVCAVLAIIYVMSFDEPSKNSSGDGASSANSAANNENSAISASSDEDELARLKEAASNLQNSAVSQLYLKSCAPCHAKDGSGIIAPSIIGKSKEQILARLADYKANKIPNSLMKGLLDNVSQEDLNALATEIAAFETAN